MSVLAINRKESKHESIHYAITLRDMLMDLCQRNFGIKDLNHIVRVRYAYGKDKTEDFARYGYLMQNSKNNIDMTTKLLMNNLASAYGLYPTSNRELNQRRAFLNDAIGNCTQLIFELQDVVKRFDVDINAYDSYQKAIDRAIGLIKKWRQRDNKLKSHFTDNF